MMCGLIQIVKWDMLIGWIHKCIEGKLPCNYFAMCS